jgi:hypothetical protein
MMFSAIFFSLGCRTIRIIRILNNDIINIKLIKWFLLCCLMWFVLNNIFIVFRLSKMKLKYKIADIVYGINSACFPIVQERKEFEVFLCNGDSDEYPTVEINLTSEPINIPDDAEIMFDCGDWAMLKTNDGVRYLKFYGNKELGNSWIAEMPNSSFDIVNIHYPEQMLVDGVLASPIRYPLGREIAMYRGLSLGGIMMHGGAASYNGKAVLYTGPSESGKSTMSRCLRDSKYDFKMMSDERPVISLIDGVYHACGTPWPSSECVVGDYTAPLKSIMFLVQFPENKLVPITRKDAFERIMKMICIPLN